MAKSPKRELKVFQAQFGFYDTVVAAKSQVAALRAWGVHQNLFQSGQARSATGPAAVTAAREHPEIPLRRPVGSSDTFSLAPKGLPKAPDAPKPAKAKRKARAKPDRAPADRSTLDAAEAALRKIDESRKAEEGDFRRRQNQLDTALNVAQAAYVRNRKVAAAAVVQARQARQAYRDAGGED